jgi:predicted dehydrogenase
VLAAHHPRFHPAVATATGRVRSGALGLVHAVHGELLVGPGDGPHPLGELRNLAVYALDVVQSLAGGPGPLRGTAHAVSSPAGSDHAGEAHTIALRLEPDVAVTLLVGRGGPSDRVPEGAPTWHRYRVLGSHGQLLVDLDSPALELVGGPRLPFGPGSVERLLEAALAGTTTPGLGHARDLSHLIDALVASAATHDVITFGGDR